MLTATPKIVGKGNAEPWEFYLRGLWESGLRLSESLALRWDDAPGAIVVDLSGHRPMLRIPAESQKANRDQLHPITPEFARHLQSVPEGQRRGRVFKLVGIDGTPMRASRRLVGVVVSAIGEKAGVVVDPDTGKTASAHDLRRAFGQRWSSKVMPNVLRELMRHTDIGTTMRFYVGQNAEATADALWSTEGNNLGNTPAASENVDAKNT